MLWSYVKVYSVKAMLCLSLFGTKSLGIFSRFYRSPLVPRTNRTRWPGNGLWQHLGVRLWYWNESANVWNFDTLDRIRLWGQRPWCHGDPAKMVIKQNNSRATRLDVCKQQISIRGIIKANRHSLCCSCCVQREPADQETCVVSGWAVEQSDDECKYAKQQAK